MHELTNGATNVLTIEKLFDKIDRVYQEGATVVATLKDSAGANITGAVAFSMAQVVGTTGRNTLYRAELAHTIALPSGTVGSAVVTMTNTAGKVLPIDEPVQYN